MKDFFKKKDTNVEATEVTESGMPKFQNPPKVPSPVTFDVPPPKDWKSQRFHSCSEATDFMNEKRLILSLWFQGQAVKFSSFIRLNYGTSIHC
jgi:hypothetical protein